MNFPFGTTPQGISLFAGWDIVLFKNHAIKPVKSSNLGWILFNVLQMRAFLKVNSQFLNIYQHINDTFSNIKKFSYSLTKLIVFSSSLVF